MSDRSRYYVVGAFLLGVALTLAYNKRSSPAGCGDASAEQPLKQQQSLFARFAKINFAGKLKKSLLNIESSLGAGGGNIKEGIEGCIGDTPLIRIKSLSDYTGCDILAKAEVGSMAAINMFSANAGSSVPQRSGQ
jgi:cysteine synthase A